MHFSSLIFHFNINKWTWKKEAKLMESGLKWTGVGKASGLKSGKVEKPKLTNWIKSGLNWDL